VSVAKDGNGTAKGRAPWMPFWGTDFMAATLGWSASERGAYMILLWAAWEGDGLPSDPERLFRLDPDIRSAWHLLEDKFPVYGDGKRRNPRQERERGEMRESGKRNADRARKAAAARWDAPSNARSNAPAMLGSCQTQTQTHTQSLSETEPIRDTLNGSAVEPDSSVNDPKPNRRATIPQAALDALWLKFPRKVGKKRAMALLDKGVREIMEDIEHDEPTDALIYMGERIDALAQQHRTTDPKFIPHPATWLGQGRYLDPEETA
jgi:uncharacterized protein YdaU (DUF1376 family)